MPFIPEDQRIIPTICALNIEIDNFDAIVRQRVNHPDDWDDVHLHDMTVLANDLRLIKLRLIAVMHTTG